MNKVFCVSCGFKILYEINKPKFCSSCGEPIGSVSSSAKVEEVEEKPEDVTHINYNGFQLKLVDEYDS